MKNKYNNSTLLRAAFLMAALPMLLAGTLFAQSSAPFVTWHFENPTEVLSDTRITSVNGFWYPERGFFAVVDTQSYSGLNSIALSYNPAAIGGANANNFRMSLDNVHVQGVKPQQTVSVHVFVPEEFANVITEVIVYDMWNRAETGGSGFDYKPTRYILSDGDVPVGQWVQLTHLINRAVTKETVARIGVRVDIDVAYTGNHPMVLIDFITTDPDAVPLERTTTNLEPISEIPGGFSLEQNFPNPFNPTTNIEFSIPETSNVTLEVFSIQGQRVATLVDGTLNAGTHSVNFNAANLPSGMYMYRIQAGNFTKVNKMTLVK